MNNLKKLQELTGISTIEIADALDIEVETVEAWQNEEKVPSVGDFEALSGIFSSQLDAQGIDTQSTKHPIHIRLSVDYLLNLGITLSDWITLKWAFEGQWNNDQLVVGFFSNNQLVRVISTESEFSNAFAGYLILQTEGEFEPYIDEFDNDTEYDWRLLRLNDKKFVDITNNLIAANLPVIS
ncbi:XRE family transcriptional regulator [Leuconostoc koreense]|nr:XRE family transcriptional regulator [Leuconostoc mesenteroides]QGM25513.1 XRE family transcriptional regulator [Leuconostoc mesenteroides subsp. mesenteroides]